MAPPKVPPKKASTAVAAPKATALATRIPTSLLEEDAKTEQMGFQKDDLAIPFLRMVQALSPQRKKNDALFIEGAEEGDIFNSVTTELWKGDDGVIVVPVSYSQSFIEWRPRNDGGGLVKDHGTDGRLLAECTKNEKGTDITPDGNEFVRSGLYYVLVVDPTSGRTQQIALALSSTQLKKSRKWNTLIASLKISHPETGLPFQPAPFYMSYKFTSVPEENDKGSWMGWKIEQHQATLELPQGDMIYLEARAFKKLVDGGQVRVNVESLVDQAATEPGTDAF